ncbi:putative mitochondrial protein [Arachis hypogaea]|nr:putative mitochondrial protein [Arachis hypogaea]
MDLRPKDQGNLLDISLLGRSLRCPTIWWCADKIYPGKRFYKYAILGDDICIADSKVAEVYLSTLKDLGRGKPLNPYLKGRKVFYLLKEPKEVRLFPEQLVFDGEREILERNVVYQWMRQWFTWLSWYHTISSNPDPSLDQFFDAPICATSWKRQDF